eukprot:3253505-Heterocapsa_arctica.AAC.1
MQEDTQPTGEVQYNEVQEQQHIAETENGNQDDVQAQEEHLIEDDTADTQTFWENAENDHKTAEVEKDECDS